MQKLNEILRSLLFLLLGIASIDTVCGQPVIYRVRGVYGGGNTLVVENGQISHVGKMPKKTAFPGARIEKVKAWVYPGFIDAHCHFYYYGLGLTECQLVGCNSEQEMIDRVMQYAAVNPQGWLIGRGWDQNRWASQKFPTRRVLDSLFPTRPVILKRIDGHAILANNAAIQAAKFDTQTDLPGGEIIRENGAYTGVFTDLAYEPILSAIPGPSRERQMSALRLAGANCLKAGLTGICDAGLPASVIQLIDSLQKAGELPLRISAMIEPSEASRKVYMHRNEKYESKWLTVHSIKYYLDGALGSRGACLKEDYCDRPGHKGMLLIEPEAFDSACAEAARWGFRVCVHAIGDSANRFALNTMQKYLPDGGLWRIEHAQVIDQADFKRFRPSAETNGGQIIPSVQPTHATSDGPWAETRLCAHRMQGAYAYKTLLAEAGIIALGTDFPVEEIHPLATYLAAVHRSSASGEVQGFRKEEALAHDECIKGMTAWAAQASGLSNCGVIRLGAHADLVFLSRDLAKTPEKKVMKTRVRTMTAGVWR